MNEEGFRRYLKETGKPGNRIEREVRKMKEFELYLSKHRNRKFGAETAEDLRDFVNRLGDRGEKVNVWLWVLSRYYNSVSNDLMLCAVNEMIGLQFIKVANLKDFLGINRQHTQALRKDGVSTSEHLLNVGRTEEGREKLAERTGVPLRDILELVKLADLSRIPGLARKRARLYYDAGLETFDKIAELDQEKMRKMLVEFVERTRFHGSPPTPAEAAFTVRLAKYLPRIVEY